MAVEAPDGYGSPESPETVVLERHVTAAVRADGFPADQLPVLFDTVFTRLFPVLAEVGVHPVGPAYSLYTSSPAQTVDIEVGVPVDRVLEGDVVLGTVDVEGAGEVQLIATASAIPGGRVAAASHHGGFDGLSSSWQTFLGALEDRGDKPDVPFWEVYVTEPAPDMDPAQLRTDLFTSLQR